jgi:hypothetical protein
MCFKSSEGVVRLAESDPTRQAARCDNSPNRYRDFRSPAEIFEHAVWLYHRFSFSSGKVKVIPVARGLALSVAKNAFSMRCSSAPAATAL